MVAFQQIESEEAMDGGMPSIRLFGVTDVSCFPYRVVLTNRPATASCVMSMDFFHISTSPRQ